MGFSIPLDKWINENYETFEQNFLSKRDLYESIGINFEFILLHLKEHKEKKKLESYIMELNNIR